jgi:hypothetical protein
MLRQERVVGVWPCPCTPINYHLVEYRSEESSRLGNAFRNPSAAPCSQQSRKLGCFNPSVSPAHRVVDASQKI